MTILTTGMYAKRLHDEDGSTAGDADRTACPYCSDSVTKVYHGGKCPKVKSIEYHPNGTIKKVEFHDERFSPNPYVK